MVQIGKGSGCLTVTCSALYFSILSFVKRFCIVELSDTVTVAFKRLVKVNQKVNHEGIEFKSAATKMKEGGTFDTS
jgi:hypothetical protein